MRHETAARAEPPGSDEITAPTRAVASGDRLKDRYDVIAHIGSGGMADVFHAWDELFCRDVAIKVLKLARINEAMKKRVLREARASCAVDHPHMLRVTDMGFVGEAPFLVTDLLRGTSLGEALRRAPDGRLEWRQAVRWLLPAMDALHAAHEVGVIHRDIKPENLFLHRRGETDVLMVLDLGIVKFTDLDGKSSRWTQSGVILGTAAYMAPEQANGGAVDRRSDVYSMGVTLYRLLSGQHLFPPATHANVIEMMAHHIWEPPPRLLDPALPPALVEAVYTAVAKRPEQRHPSMRAFSAALSACLDAAPRAVTARRVATSVGLVGLGAALALAVSRFTLPDVAGPEAAPAARVSQADGALIIVANDEPGELCVPPDLPNETTAGACEPGPITPRGHERRSRPSDAFERANEAIHRCVRVHGDPDVRVLPVRVVVRGDGSVAAVDIVGDSGASFLAICVHDRLAELRFAPGRPGTLEHIYRFSTTKERPR